jgi:AbrB family looped-hinge helix DNA binding protein
MEMRISSKGWVVIPAELRKKYALEPGDLVQIVDYGGVLAIIPSLEDPIEDGAGVLRGGQSLGKALLKERDSEREHEDRK